MNSNLMDTGANEGFVGPLEGYDSREATRQTQLLEFFGDEPALQCERRGGGHFEEGAKCQVPSLHELPNKTSSLRTQEPFRERDGDKYSEETLLQLEKDGSNFYTQTQTQSHLMGPGSLGEDRLYYKRHGCGT